MLSAKNDDPEGASRPFDKNRDGMVLGEGGADGGRDRSHGRVAGRNSRGEPHVQQHGPSTDGESGETGAQPAKRRRRRRRSSGGAAQAAPESPAA